MIETGSARRVRHRRAATHRRIGADDPQRLDVASRDGLQHGHRLETFPPRHAWRFPETADTIDLLRRKSHMCGKLIGETANFAPAHGIRLPGQGEWPGAPGRPNAPRGKMAIDKGVDLVGPLPGLVDALL